MLLKNYTMEIFRPECNPQFQSLHCFAHLDEDIREVLPYLNTVLGGSGYTQDPPSLMLQIHGRLIALHPKKIAINALKNDKEAEKILEWLRREINQTWEKRDEITPSYGTPPKPQPMEVLKLLPKTNCGECGQPTCIVFASLVIQGVKEADDCLQLTEQNKTKLNKYLNKFSFIDL
jgi:ArsR family metal-binding transcriptional regulator